MMVTFISQCEKKALKKTRRVLDAFANRIGDNAWQTVITEEGLKTVKKMLRQTASKSTAVSCHWIRSRSRSQFLWVVGNKSKFDGSGMVPVNYTSNQIIIGDIKIMTDQVFANTKGQRLDQHLFAVGYLAYKIIKRLVPNNNNLAIACIIAGCWHDIGKIDPAFNDWLVKKLDKRQFEDVPDDGQHIDKKTGKFSWQKHPRHNEISLMLFSLMFPSQEINPDTYERIRHAIYWHHAKPLRSDKDEIKRIADIYSKLDGFEKNYSKITSTAIAILKSIKDMFEGLKEDIIIDFGALSIPKRDDIEDRVETLEVPTYKRYSTKEAIEKYRKNIQHNSLNNLARSAVVTADRLVSRELTGESLNERIISNSLDEILDHAFQKGRGLTQHIQDCLDGFNRNNPDTDRNKQQAIAAKRLADEAVKIGILRGPAGCGKTKIALEWALNTHAKKIWWVCPRVQVCQGVFIDLTSRQYLPKARIELCTGEFKHTSNREGVFETPDGEEFSGDIVITTIDQVINAITTHRNVDTLISFMDAHVVFDEYHEYITMPAFNLLFAELVRCKEYQQDDDKTLPNTLLVSATPNPLFIKKFLYLQQENDIVGIDSFNNSRYQIRFAEYDEKFEDDGNPLFQVQPANTFVISNTAITAQKAYIENQETENGLLLHSKYKYSDRKDLFEKAFDAFKEDGNRAYDVLRSGPVVQAALNITCDRMVSEMTHAENFLQRMGRLDRFGKNKDMNQYVIAITDAVKRGKSKDNSSRFLAKLFRKESTKAWYDFLRHELPTDGPITINEIYSIYDRFYKDENCCRLVEQDLMVALLESKAMIDKRLVDPVILPTYKKEPDKIKIKKHSLRGDSRFVQMARCKINSRQDYEFENEYAFNENQSEESITMGVETFRGRGDSEKDLVAFMKKKHHNIKGNTKAYKDIELLNQARDPQTPIYLSYTPDDLSRVNSKKHPHAIYYAIGKKQPIGAISLKQLNNEGE